MSHARFMHCARKLYCEPWAITPAMHAQISDIFQRHVAGQSIDFEQPEDDVDPTDYDVIDGVAVLPIKGVISKDISDMERMSGAVDVEDVDAMLRSAMSRGDVDAIVLRVNSPGGSVDGVPELADAVAAASQIVPVFAYADGLMASAAYYIAAGATAIYASRSAEVGSIGVYIALLDQSAAYAQQGYKRDIIKSSDTPMKAAGYPGTSLTPEQRAVWQSQVDFLYGEFSGFVRAHRSVQDIALDGRTFLAPFAAEAGLVDSVASLQDAIRDAGEMGRKRKS